MRVVFDTNVLISATLWNESSAQKILHKLIEEDYDIFLSLEIIEEYKKVLKRDFDYTEDEINNFISIIMQFSNIIEPDTTIEVIEDDPEDNRILECAVSASADFILSYDKHLLILKEFNNIKIIKPEELIL